MKSDATDEQITNLLVAPLVGAWIEILLPTNIAPTGESLLSWERGLKYNCHSHLFGRLVAPLVGAWIEIELIGESSEKATTVAPLVGAWIEMIVRKTL